MRHMEYTRRHQQQLSSNNNSSKAAPRKNSSINNMHNGEALPLEKCTDNNNLKNPQEISIS